MGCHQVLLELFAMPAPAARYRFRPLSPVATSRRTPCPPLSTFARLCPPLSSRSTVIFNVQVDWDSLGFGYVETDSHIEYTWRDGQWDIGRLVTEPTVQLHISSGVLHYGQALFEGLKAFEGSDGRVRVFQPFNGNAKRLQRGCRRLQMPVVPTEMFHTAVARVIQANRHWVPPHRRGSSAVLSRLEVGLVESGLEARSTVRAAEWLCRISTALTSTIISDTCLKLCFNSENWKTKAPSTSDQTFLAVVRSLAWERHQSTSLLFLYPRSVITTRVRQTTA